VKPALSLRTLRDLRSFLRDGAMGHYSALSRSLEEIERAIASAERASSLKSRRNRAQGEKKATKRDAAAEVRAAVSARAGGRCESCGLEGITRPAPLLEWDHAFGRARAESIETTWLLCGGPGRCHYQKTNNIPSARVWLERFTAHALAYGYHEAAEQARRRLEGIAALREARP